MLRLLYPTIIMATVISQSSFTVGWTPVTSDCGSTVSYEIDAVVNNIDWQVISNDYKTRDLEITYPVRLLVGQHMRLFKSCYASLKQSLVLVGVASFYRILIVQRRARASQLHKRSAHLKVNTCSFQSCN